MILPLGRKCARASKRKMEHGVEFRMCFHQCNVTLTCVWKNSSLLKLKREREKI